jgi:hypothetical protein
VASRFSKGNIFSIFVGLYVKCPRRTYYLKSFCHRSCLSWGILLNVYKPRIQVSLHHVYVKGTPALEAQLSIGLSVPIQEKTRKENHPWGSGVCLCICFCLCAYLSSCCSPPPWNLCRHSGKGRQSQPRNDLTSYYEYVSYFGTLKSNVQAWAPPHLPSITSLLFDASFFLIQLS